MSDSFLQWRDSDDEVMADARAGDNGWLMPIDFNLEGDSPQELEIRGNVLREKNAVLGLQIAEFDHEQLKAAFERRKNQAWFNQWFGWTGMQNPY